MCHKVVIDLKNPNTLIAMAQVSQNGNNPYFTFCEYIKYCIFANPNNTITLSEIKDSVGNEFGIYMPNNIVLTCLQIIQNENLVKIKNHVIERIGSYDIETFDQKRENYRKIENELISLLINYVKKYDKNWYYEYAREQLIKVLDRKGLAFDIFIHGELIESNGSISHDTKTVSIDEILLDDEDAEMEETDDQPLYTDGFFVGKFIQEIISSDTIYREYLLKICEGLMLCVGSYQLPSAEAKIVIPQIKNTVFYFDTRLLLRYIGCAGDAAVTASRELVALIQNSGGIVAYYPQTFEEIERAFDEAIRNLTNGYPPRDDEMRLFAAKSNYNSAILSSKKASFKQELSSDNINLKPRESFTDIENIRFGFERKDLQQYMEGKLKWEQKTIENDSWSIWETHMRRRGLYSSYFGESDRLPVFVTSNAKLISIALNYRDERKNTNSINSWKSNRLPVITDMRLTCRLWSPASDSERLTLLYLTSNAVAAQRPTMRYIRTVRSLALEFEKNCPEYSGISLPSYFDDNVTEAILRHTQGKDENLNIGSFASSIEEISELKAKEQEEKTNQAILEKENVQTMFDAQTQTIINDAVERNSKKLGMCGLILNTVIKWPYLTTLVFLVITLTVSYFSQNYNWLWAIVVPAFVKFVELICSSLWIEKMLLQFFLPKSEKILEKRIEKKLIKAEMPYKETIIAQLKNTNALFIQCKKIVDEKKI